MLIAFTVIALIDSHPAVASPAVRDTLALRVCACPVRSPYRVTDVAPVDAAFDAATLLATGLVSIVTHCVSVPDPASCRTSVASAAPLLRWFRIDATLAPMLLNDTHICAELSAPVLPSRARADVRRDPLLLRLVSSVTYTAPVVPVLVCCTLDPLTLKSYDKPCVSVDAVPVTTMIPLVATAVCAATFVAIDDIDSHTDASVAVRLTRILFVSDENTPSTDTDIAPVPTVFDRTPPVARPARSAVKARVRVLSAITDCSVTTTDVPVPKTVPGLLHSIELPEAHSVLAAAEQCIL